MILDQIAAMDPDSGNWTQEITGEISKGFDKVMGTFPGLSSSLTDINTQLRKTSGSMTQFMARDLKLSESRNSLLSGLDSSVQSQTNRMMKGFGEVNSNVKVMTQQINAQGRTLAGIEREMSSLNITTSNILKLLAKGPQTKDLPAVASTDISPMVVEMENFHKDMVDGIRAILTMMAKQAGASSASLSKLPRLTDRSFSESEISLKAVSNVQTKMNNQLDDTNDLLDSFYNEFLDFKDAFYNYSHMFALFAQTNFNQLADLRENTSSGAGSGASAITRALGDSSKSQVKGWKGVLLEGLDNIFGKLTGFFTGAGFGLAVKKVMGDAHSAANNLAARGGMNAHGASWDRISSIFKEGTERNRGSGHLPGQGHLIDAQTYYESIDKALAAGMSHVQDLEGITADLALNAKLLPDMMLDLTSGYAKDLMVQQENGADTIRSVSMVIKDFSDNMYVSSETLNKAVGKYHNTVKAMTKNMTDYVKKMGEYIKVMAGMDENNLNNLGMDEFIDKIMNTPMSQWSDEMYMKAASVGLTGGKMSQIEEMMMNGDTEGAYAEVAKAIQSAADKYDYRDENGKGDLQAYRRYKEIMGGVGGWDIAEIQGATSRDEKGQSNITRFLDGLKNNKYGEEITGANSEEEMKQATDEYASRTLEEQTNLTLEEEMKNIGELTVQTNDILNSILGFLNNMGISGGVLGSVLGWGVGKLVGGLAKKGLSKIGSLFGKGAGSATTAAGGAAEAAGGMASSAAGLADDIPRLTGPVADTADDIIDLVEGVDYRVLDSADEAASGLSKFTSKLKAQGGLLGKAGDKIDDFARVVKGSKLGQFADDIGRGFSKLGTGIGKFGTWFKNTKFGSFADDAVKGLSKGFSGLKSKVGSVFAKNSDDIAGGVTKFFSKNGDDIAKGAGKFLAKSGDDIAKVGGKLASGASKFAKAAPIVGAAVEGVVGAVKVKGDLDRGDTRAAAEHGGETAGSIGGGLAGAAAGAAIGSVVPVIGTAIGGLIGGIVGAFGGEKLGGAIGKGIHGEQEFTGDQKDILADSAKMLEQIRDTQGEEAAQDYMDEVLIPQMKEAGISTSYLDKYEEGFFGGNHYDKFLKDIEGGTFGDLSQSGEAAKALAEETAGMTGALPETSASTGEFEKTPITYGEYYEDMPRGTSADISGLNPATYTDWDALGAGAGEGLALNTDLGKDYMNPDGTIDFEKYKASKDATTAQEPIKKVDKDTLIQEMHDAVLEIRDRINEILGIEEEPKPEETTDAGVNAVLDEAATLPEEKPKTFFENMKDKLLGEVGEDGKRSGGLLKTMGPLALMSPLAAGVGLAGMAAKDLFAKDEEGNSKFGTMVDKFKESKLGQFAAATPLGMGISLLGKGIKAFFGKNDEASTEESVEEQKPLDLNTAVIEMHGILSEIRDALFDYFGIESKKEEVDTRSPAEKLRDFVKDKLFGEKDEEGKRSGGLLQKAGKAALMMSPLGMGINLLGGLFGKKKEDDFNLLANYLGGANEPLMHKMLREKLGGLEEGFNPAGTGGFLMGGKKSGFFSNFLGDTISAMPGPLGLAGKALTALFPQDGNPDGLQLPEAETIKKPDSIESAENSQGETEADKIVDAITLLQDNVLMRLDKMTGGGPKNTYIPFQPNAKFVGDDDSSVKNLDIRNYAV